MKIYSQIPSAILGNGYFWNYPEKGKLDDGSYRYLELQIPLYQGFGPFISGVEVRSLTNDYYFSKKEIAAGITYGGLLKLIDSLPSQVYYGWVNVAYGRSSFSGRVYLENGLYQELQDNGLLVLKGGILVRNKDFAGLFAQQILYADFKIPFSESKQAFWNGEEILSTLNKAEALVLSIENTSFPFKSKKKKEAYLAPISLISYIYEPGRTQSLDLGLGLTFTWNKFQVKGKYCKRFQSLANQNLIELSLLMTLDPRHIKKKKSNSNEKNN